MAPNIKIFFVLVSVKMSLLVESPEPNQNSKVIKTSNNILLPKMAYSAKRSSWLPQTEDTMLDLVLNLIDYTGVGHGRKIQNFNK